MSITNYTELVSAVQDWLMRDDIPVGSLVTLAEAQFNRTLRLRQTIKRATTTLDEGYEGLPVDCLEVKRLTLDGRPLEYVPPFQMANLLTQYPSGDTTWYSVVGDQFQFCPPATSGLLELTYYARLLPLGEDEPINGLLDWAPDIYLYGCLLQAAPYLRDDARIAIWAAAYDRIVDQLNSSDDSAEYPGPLQMQIEGVAR